MALSLVKKRHPLCQAEHLAGAGVSGSVGLLAVGQVPILVLTCQPKATNEHYPITAADEFNSLKAAKFCGYPTIYLLGSRLGS